MLIKNKQKKSFENPGLVSSDLRNSGAVFFSEPVMNSQNDQPLVGLIASLVEQCIGIAVACLHVSSLDFPLEHL